MSPTFPTLTNPAITRTPFQLTSADITGSCLRTPLLYLPSFSFPACSRGLRGKGVRGTGACIRGEVAGRLVNRLDGGRVKVHSRVRCTSSSRLITHVLTYLTNPRLCLAFRTTVDGVSDNASR